MENKLVFNHRFFEHICEYKKADLGKAPLLFKLVVFLLKWKIIVLILLVFEKVMTVLLNLPIPGYKSLVSIFVTIFPGLPNMGGCYLRSLYYRGKMKKMGPNVLIDRGVQIYYPKNVELSEFCYLDKNVIIAAKSAFIGKRVHIAPNVFITGGGDFIIEDYACIAAGSIVVTSTETLKDGTRSSGPMVPVSQRNVLSGSVVIKRDAFIAVNVTILTNSVIEEGSVVMPGSIIKGTLDPWTYYKNRMKPEALSRKRQKLDF